MSRTPLTREAYALRKYQYQCWARSILARQTTHEDRRWYMDLVEKHHGPAMRRRLRRYMRIEHLRRQQHG